MKPQSSARSARQQAARKKRLASSVSVASVPRLKHRTARSKQPLPISRRRAARRSEPGFLKAIVRVSAIAAIRFAAFSLRSAVKLGRKKIAGQPVWLISLAALGLSFFIGTSLGMSRAGMERSPNASAQSVAYSEGGFGSNGRPHLSPLPTAKEVWTCDVVVIGGSLGGVAAASHSMQSGATTCLIELTPWLGGQISSQGVSALDESQVMRSNETLSESWMHFKRLLAKQTVKLPSWTTLKGDLRVDEINSCWVGILCFPPKAGASASEQLLKNAATRSPKSRWSTSTAFKGADFDDSGRLVTAIHAVRRTPRDPNYLPKGRFSAELSKWYAWSSTDEFDKTPIRLEAPPGKQMMVIDATDTTELVGWAGVPHRLGSDSIATTGERNASRQDNQDCTQAFTYPFVLAIRDDQGASLKTLTRLESDYSKEEHRKDYDLQGFPVFTGRSFFNYRRIVSVNPGDPYASTPSPGDMTLVNWNRGNDWKFMDPPLILSDTDLDKSGQRQNWLGGLSIVALRHGENHALLFAHWLLENHAKELPLSYLWGTESPLNTASGLSMVPYIREGRRIVGRKAYNQREFAVREADLRIDLPGSRDLSPTAIARVHYSIDIHGCRYRNSEDDGEAASAPTLETNVRPTLIPIEGLIPRGVDNLLIGGKGIAVTHIANGMTRIHQGEWSIGASAGAIAGWLTTRAQPGLLPQDIASKHLISQVRDHMSRQGLGLDWHQTTSESKFMKSFNSAEEPE
ncbi:FAD-dependent oxidoreductase [Phormidium sp. CLA17]|uniref:FAD-dependent oxidoreductase n=1 Tax=Leptolyngbya sp. Cla-17 TaxID=2803751 RepID=UPI0018D67469|nr:FAD-dependent oxidoreductase [Leptolyngbya sp. Cla-17]MBM0744005.1 FAD-dependent oxidoreductase [Leptolyngbya sp. Cla-17]